MLDKLLDPIFAPFRALRTMVFTAKSLPNSVKGQVSRAGSEASSIKNDFKGYRDDIKNAPGTVQGVADKAKNAKVPKKKMGLFGFGKKAACESCGQKLHPSWDECPYCGWKKGQPPAAAGGGGGGAAGGGAAPAGGGGGGGSAPARTMALDMSGGGAVGVGAGMLGWFIPLEGPRVGELIELRGRVTVGKAADNAVVIDDPSVSGHHCEFQGSAMGFKLNDLGSTNGTFVNDKRVQSHDLVDNDNVKLGKVRFKYKQRD